MRSNAKRVHYKLCLALVLSQVLAANAKHGIRLGQRLQHKQDAGLSPSVAIEDQSIEQVDIQNSGLVYGSESNARLPTYEGRSLKQQANASSCSLTALEIEEIYEQETRVWTLEDNLLEQGVGIIQDVIDCSSENDVILLRTNRTLQPPDTIVIRWSLTLTADPGASVTQNSQMTEADTKANFTCTEETNLISVRRGAVRIANIIVTGCRNSSDIVSLDMACENGDSSGEIQLQHVEFEDNLLSGEARIIATTNPNCTNLTLHNVVLVRNNCSRVGCISLSGVNTLTNVTLDGNRVARNATVSHAAFVSPPYSETTVTSLSAIRNRIRIFSLFISTLSMSESLFQRNRVRNSTSVSDRSIGGSALLSNQSIVSFTDCQFKGNSGQNGGALHVTYRSVAVVQGCSFRNGTVTSDGGAIYLHQNSSMNISNSLFSGNHARSRGGALFSTDLSNSTISNCTFGANNSAVGNGGAISASNSSVVSLYNTTIFKNEARHGGGINLEESVSVLSECNLTQNNARENGGAIRGRISGVEISGANLSRNRAYRGGGIRLYEMNAVDFRSVLFEQNNANRAGGAIHTRGSPAYASISSCNFSGNQANHGASLYLRNATINIADSRFERNNANSTGAGLGMYESNATMRHCLLLSNTARSYAGIGVYRMSMFIGEGVRVLSNVASENGGGIGVEYLSRCLCLYCEFRNNSAERGAGMYAISDNNSVHIPVSRQYIPIVAQLQDSVFEGNNASEYGGGIYLQRPRNMTITCTDLHVPCGRVVLLGTTFNNNIAGNYGSAVLTTDPTGVLVSCNYSQQESDFLHNDELIAFPTLSPERACVSWKGNTVTGEFTGSVVGTHGLIWNFSIHSEHGERIVHYTREEFVLENLKSGEPLPVINISMLDAYGNGPVSTEQYSFQVEVSSPDGYFPGSVTATITGGVGSISSIRFLNRPGSYTLEIQPNGVAIPSVTLQIRINYCKLDEQLATGELCQPCDALEYNFDPINGTCTSCPNDANCEGRYITPNDGFWHRGPCHARVMKCLNEEACQRDQRQQGLENFTQAFANCTLNRSALIYYGEALCDEGYEGPLCGSCEPGYGLSLEFHCSECPHDAWSAFTILFAALYLLAVASFTIRGGLPTGPTTAMQSPRSSTQPRIVWNLTRSVAVNIQMVERMRDGYVSTEEVNLNSQRNASNEEAAQDIGDLEMTRWMTTEVLKVTALFSLFKHLACVFRFS